MSPRAVLNLLQAIKSYGVHVQLAIRFLRTSISEYDLQKFMREFQLLIMIMPVHVHAYDVNSAV